MAAATASSPMAWARLTRMKAKPAMAASGGSGKSGMRNGRGRLGLRMRRQDDADLLQEKLQQDARDDEQSNDLRERKETEERADKAESDERAVRNAVAGMDGGEKAEVVAIARGGVGHARVAE